MKAGPNRTPLGRTQQDWCPYKKTKKHQEFTWTEKKNIFEDTARRQPSASQGERPQGTPDLQTP